MTLRALWSGPTSRCPSAAGAPKKGARVALRRAQGSCASPSARSRWPLAAPSSCRPRPSPTGPSPTGTPTSARATAAPTAAYDLASYAGTPVVPFRSGKVVFAGYKSNCGGLQIYISHGNGLYSAYYHLSSEYVYKGQWVTAQTTTIGRVGTSGCTTGPHLHFEVWHGYPWASGSYRVHPWATSTRGRTPVPLPLSQPGLSAVRPGPAATLAGVPAERIAESLAFINWTVLTALAVGSFAAVVAGRFRTEATRGYLAFTAFSAAAFGAPRVPRRRRPAGPLAGPRRPADPAWETPRRVALAACRSSPRSTASPLARGRRAAPGSPPPGWPRRRYPRGRRPVVGRRRRWRAPSCSWSSPASRPLLGGVWAAMILGHWYLVTPRCPRRP